MIKYFSMMSLSNYWKNWIGIGRFLTNKLARVILVIFYFIIVLPFGIGVRLFSDFLDLKSTPKWLPKTGQKNSLDDARRMY